MHKRQPWTLAKWLSPITCYVDRWNEWISTISLPPLTPITLVDIPYDVRHRLSCWTTPVTLQDRYCCRIATYHYSGNAWHPFVPYVGSLTDGHQNSLCSKLPTPSSHSQITCNPCMGTNYGVLGGAITNWPTYAETAGTWGTWRTGTTSGGGRTPILLWLWCRYLLVSSHAATAISLMVSSILLMSWRDCLYSSITHLSSSRMTCYSSCAFYCSYSLSKQWRGLLATCLCHWQSSSHSTG